MLLYDYKRRPRKVSKRSCIGSNRSTLAKTFFLVPNGTHLLWPITMGVVTMGCGARKWLGSGMGGVSGGRDWHVTIRYDCRTYIGCSWAWYDILSHYRLFCNSRTLIDEILPLLWTEQCLNRCLNRCLIYKKLSYRRDSARRRHYAILLVLHSFQDMADYWFVTNDDDDET